MVRQCLRNHNGFLLGNLIMSSPFQKGHFITSILEPRISRPLKTITFQGPCAPCDPLSPCLWCCGATWWGSRQWDWQGWTGAGRPVPSVAPSTIHRPTHTKHPPEARRRQILELRNSFSHPDCGCHTPPHQHQPTPLHLQPKSTSKHKFVWRKPKMMIPTWTRKISLTLMQTMQETECIIKLAGLL